MRKVQLLMGRLRWGIWTLLLSVVLCTGSLVQASQLTAPGLAASDGMVVGNAVAYPFNAATALFHNPAQLSLVPNSFSTGAFNIMFHPSYENRHGIFLPDSLRGALPPDVDPEVFRALNEFSPSPDRSGYYDSTSREFPIAPNFGYRTDRFAPFAFGMGMYGSLGFAFNYGAEPEHGVPNNFFTELVAVSLAPSLSYSLASNLHIGVSLNPTYGRLKTKSPTPCGRLDLDVRGPGMFGTVGVMYQPTDRLNLGLTYKTPGKIWMFGNARVCDGIGDDATVYFNIPQNVKFGFAYRITDRLTFVVQARWSHLSVFDETRVRFEDHTFLNQPAVGRAKDRWRMGGGFTYQVSENVMLGVGFSHEPWAIKDDSLKPTLADNTDYMVAFGGQYKHGAWIFDVIGGMGHLEPRRADVRENPAFPGRYDLGMNVFGFQMTRLLGPSETEATGDPAAATSLASYRDYAESARYSIAASQSKRNPDPDLLTDPSRSDALLDTLIAKLSRNRCTLLPRSESERVFALSDKERQRWCRRWDDLRPA